ncbi:hypothetical protein PS1_030074 [Malus domestica]
MEVYHLDDKQHLHCFAPPSKLNSGSPRSSPSSSNKDDSSSSSASAPTSSSKLLRLLRPRASNSAAPSFALQKKKNAVAVQWRRCKATRM